MVQLKWTDTTKAPPWDERFSCSSTRQFPGDWVVFVGCLMLTWISLVPLAWTAMTLLDAGQRVDAALLCGASVMAFGWNLFHLRKLLNTLYQDEATQGRPMAGRAHWPMVFGVQMITALVCTHLAGASDPFGLQQWFWLPISAFGGLALTRCSHMVLLLGLTLLGSTAHEQMMHGTLAATYWIVGQVTSGLFIMGCCVAVTAASRQRQTLTADFHAAYAQMELRADQTSIAAAAQDRTRLAAEIHDHAVNSLTLVSTQLDATQGLLKIAPDRALETLEKARRAVRTGLAEVRRAAARRWMTVSEERSLMETLAPLILGAERTGLKLSLQQTGVSRPLPTLVENSLYRCAQEGITRSCDHSRISELSVHVDFTSESVVSMCVTDNGHDSAETGEQGHRLKGLAQRASLLHGEFAAETGANGGRLCRMALPC